MMKTLALTASCCLEPHVVLSSSNSPGMSRLKLLSTAYYEFSWGTPPDPLPRVRFAEIVDGSINPRRANVFSAFLEKHNGQLYMCFLCKYAPKLPWVHFAEIVVDAKCYIHSASRYTIHSRSKWLSIEVPTFFTAHENMYHIQE